MGKLMITAGGMATSLSDFHSGCAAMRAGMVRRAENPVIKNPEPDTGELIPVATSALWGDPLAGYGKTARLIRLLELAFADLKHTVRGALDGAKTGLVLNFSSDYYRRWHAGRLEEAFVPQVSVSNIVQRVFGELDCCVAADHVVSVFGDGVGVVDAFQQVERLFEEEAVERCLVGAVDSLLDNDTLDQLLELGVIATPANCAGFCPGEAAVLFMVERECDLGAVYLTLEGFAVAQDTAIADEKSASGMVAGSVIQQALTNAEITEPIPFGLGPNNGSAVFSYESSVALIAADGMSREAEIWHASESFGETNAVAGFLSIAVLCQAFSRGYAPAERAVVWLCSPNGRRGAFLATKGCGSSVASGPLNDKLFGLEILFEEHLEELSFLYEQRLELIIDPQMGWAEQDAFSDQRLEAHLDGLVVGGKPALELCARQALEGDAGALFAAVSVFCRLGRRDLLDAVLEDLDWNDAERVQAVANALCFELPADWAEALFGPLLRADSKLKGLVCRVIGFRRFAFVDDLIPLLNLEDPAELKAVLWALGRLQSPDAVAAGLLLVEHADAAVQEAALMMLARCGAMEQVALPEAEWPPLVRALCGRSVRDIDFLIPEQVLLAGLWGAADSLPALIEALENDALAADAALALYLMTGANLKEAVFVPEDIQEEDLFEDEIEAFRNGTLYPEGEWPGEEVERLSQNPAIWKGWLDENSTLFEGAGRYRNGIPFSKSAVLALLKAEETPDRLRKWCADELAIQYGVDSAFETEMRVVDQKKALAQMAAGV